ncbi:MAG: tRNA lysidine(34) synthetase TilS [Bacteroidales bacterium]
MLEEFLKYIKDNRLAEKSHRILLAVSGGIDSMVMADLFGRTHFDTGIAHCNFKLRGKDSEQDELFVKDFAVRTGKPLYCKSFDTKEYAERKGISIEMAARELRYGWFEDIRKKNGYDLIALAHNMSDNIETILLNLSRGTGITGLTGMRPGNGRLIRPLLFASRQAIEEYARTRSVAYRIDRSNAELKYKRNRIRHQIIPIFREINPSFDATITETAKRFSEFQEILEGFIKGIREYAVKEKNNTVIFDLKKLSGFKPLKTILFELFRQYGISPGQLKILERFFYGRTGSVLLTASHRLIKNRDEIIVTGLPEKEKKEYLVDNIDGFQRLPFIETAELIQINSEFKPEADSSAAFLDAESVAFPVTIRKWNPGDRFQPLGMSSHKKLSDYFTDRKYSIAYKEKIFVMESAGEIIWILGERIDDRYKITGNTHKVLIIRLKKDFMVY